MTCRGKWILDHGRDCGIDDAASFVLISKTPFLRGRSQSRYDVSTYNIAHATRLDVDHHSKLVADLHIIQTIDRNNKLYVTSWGRLSNKLSPTKFD